MPAAVATAGEQHRDAERDVGELGARRGRVVDEVGLGEQHHRVRPGVEGEHELAFEPTLVRRRAERVHEEHDVDVGRQRVGLEPVALERGAPDEGRAALDDVAHPLTVVGGDDPVTDRHVDVQVAHSHRIGVVGRPHHRAPPTVDAGDTSRSSR